MLNNLNAYSTGPKFAATYITAVNSTLTGATYSSSSSESSYNDVTAPMPTAYYLCEFRQEDIERPRSPLPHQKLCPPPPPFPP